MIIRSFQLFFFSAFGIFSDLNGNISADEKKDSEEKEREVKVFEDSLYYECTPSSDGENLWSLQTSPTILAILLHFFSYYANFRWVL